MNANGSSPISGHSSGLSGHRLARRWAAPALLLLALTLTACGGSGGGSDASSIEPMQRGIESGGLGAPEAPGAIGDLDTYNSTMNYESADGSVSASKGADETRPPYARLSVISKGNVSLEADDVARARFDVQKVVDSFDGEISDEETTTGDDGAIAFSRMVLRIPSEEFSAAMGELEDVAELQSSKRSSEDVTTQVIDVEVRIKVQRASINRIQALLTRADDIGDIVAIESQLTRRQAELNSLEQQQAYLADQTSLSTIVVHLEQTPDAATEPKDDDGFLAGLSTGWDGLTAFAVGAATVVGVMLPFTILLLVLAGLALPLVRPLLRRLRQRSSVTTPPVAPAEG